MSTNRYSLSHRRTCPRRFVSLPTRWSSQGGWCDLLCSSLGIIGQVAVPVQVQVKAVGGLIPGERDEFVGARTATKGAAHDAVPAKVEGPRSEGWRLALKSYHDVRLPPASAREVKYRLGGKGVEED
jgi:hypothetical protein